MVETRRNYTVISRHLPTVVAWCEASKFIVVDGRSVHARQQVSHRGHFARKWARNSRFAWRYLSPLSLKRLGKCYDIIYLIGLIVVVLVILSFFGLR
jgi:hypothetical protein